MYKPAQAQLMVDQQRKELVAGVGYMLGKRNQSESNLAASAAMNVSNAWDS